MRSNLSKLIRLNSDPYYHSVYNVENYKSFYFGKDPDGNIIFLIKPLLMQTTQNAISSIGKYLDISFNTTCEFKIQEKSHVGEFTLLTLKTQEVLMNRIFVSLCEDLIELICDEPSYDRVIEVVNGLKELFVNFLRPSTNTEIGLWGELFVISQAQNIENAIDSWHLDPYDTFDFNDGHKKMEVKTTTNNERVHSISLNQILKSIESNSLICSIMTSKIDLGLTVLDLKEKISETLDSNYKKIINTKVTISAGDQWNHFTNKYDFSTAKNSMRFFNADCIPKIDQNSIGPNISNVKFSVNLETVPDTDITIPRQDCKYLPL